MRGRTIVLVFFVGLLLALGFVFWVGATGGGTGPKNRPDTGSATGTGDPLGARPAEGVLDDGGAIGRTIRDRQVRDELRRRILAGWAAEGEGEQAEAARAGRFVPRPNPDGTGIEPSYIQKVIREDFFPMAKKCYEELLARKPDGGGLLEMEFTIVADDKLGGIVEDAALGDAGTLHDEKMATCIRESLSTLAFPPPAHDGVVTVVYPIVLSPDEPPER